MKNTVAQRKEDRQRDRLTQVEHTWTMNTETGQMLGQVKRGKQKAEKGKQTAGQVVALVGRVGMFCASTRTAGRGTVTITYTQCAARVPGRWLGLQPAPGAATALREHPPPPGSA